MYVFSLNSYNSSKRLELLSFYGRRNLAELGDLSSYLYDFKDHALSNILKYLKCFQIFELSVPGRNKSMW